MRVQEQVWVGLILKTSLGWGSPLQPHGSGSSDPISRKPRFHPAICSQAGQTEIEAST